VKNLVVRASAFAGLTFARHCCAYASRCTLGSSIPSREGVLAVLAALFRVLADGGRVGDAVPTPALSRVLVEAPDAMLSDVEVFLADKGYVQLANGPLQVFLSRVLHWPLDAIVWTRVLPIVRAAATAKRFTALAGAVVSAAGERTSAATHASWASPSTSPAVAAQLPMMPRF
jgi:hypothetical protein